MMKQLRRQILSSGRLRLASCAWLCLLAICATYAVVFSLRTMVAGLRLALSSVSKEGEGSGLPPFLNELGDFSSESHYHYDCLFFSSDTPVDEFETSTPIAKNTTCLLDITSAPDSNELQWVHFPTSMSLAEEEHEYGREGQFGLPPCLARETHRWTLGPFAKDSQQEDRGCFWKINPEAQLSRGFGALRFIQDHGVACSLARLPVDQTLFSGISPGINAFIDKHPELLRADLALVWPRRTSDGLFLDEPVNLQRHEMVRPTKRTPLRGNPIPADRAETNWQEDKNEVGSDEARSGSMSKFVASWLRRLYEESVFSSLKIGSLDLPIISHHDGLLHHHPEGVEHLYPRNAQDLPLQTLSAGMFLSKKRIWDFTKREPRYRTYFRPSPPDATPKPGQNDERGGRAQPVTGPWRSTQQPPDNYKNLNQGMAELHARWELLAQGLSRQEDIPGLRSGNTVIDERNFRSSN